MKLKQLQLKRIEQIIQEKMQVLEEGCVSIDKFRKSSRLDEKMLFEDGSPLERDLSASSLLDSLDGAAGAAAESCCVEFNNELFEHIASVVRSHGLVSASTGPDDVRSVLSDHNESLLFDALAKCTADIQDSLEKYATEISTLVSNTFIGHEK